MSDSEIITIMIGFHLGAYKTFKHYYREIVCGYWKDLFPNRLFYNRLSVNNFMMTFWEALQHIASFQKNVINLKK